MRARATVRREASAGSTRAAILAAAESILARGGEAALSIRELCARVGVTAPTIYHYFGDKDGLVAEVVDACFAEFDQALTDGPVPADPVEALAWGLERYVAYGVAHPAHYRLLFNRRLRKPTPAAVSSYGRLEDSIRAIEAAGRLAVPVEEAAPAVWAAVHGVTMLAIAGFISGSGHAARHVRDAIISALTLPTTELPDTIRPADETIVARGTAKPARGATNAARGTDDRRIPMKRESESNGFLQGNFAPWRLEGHAPDLEIDGELPRELNGTFYRNGPNPAYQPSGQYHWFDGDGMIHAITLEDGRASYRNRWVASAGLAEERRAGRATFEGLLDMKPTEAPRIKNTGNTNIVWHAGKLLALMEAALPTALLPCTLETIGEWDFGGRLGTPMTAHPKVDPETGEMLFFGYSPFPPYLTYHVADRSGALVRSEPIDLAWPSMIHDFAVTRDHVVFILCPLVFSFENVKERGGVFSWEPKRGTRLGVMPRTGGSADVRWFETDPAYVFHPLNAYEEDGRVIVDVARYGRLDFMTPAGSREPWEGDTMARLHRWTIDLVGGGVRSTPLDDTSCEFPRMDERRLGRRHRYGYAAVEPNPASTMPAWSGIRRWDLERGTFETRRFGAGCGAGEPLFVPRAAASAEDDGWVLVLVYDAARNTSDFHVLDARDIAGEPIATVKLPHRVPYGFHGNWVPA